MELLADGRPRFRQLLVLVSRQNGKTELLVILSLFWLFVEQVELVLGTSTKLDYAKESWAKAVRFAQSFAELKAEIPRGGIRRANGEQELGTSTGSRYKIAASNEEGGRSLTVHRLIEDELRQHHDWSAHEAAENAMQAVRDAQAWAISNQGDDRSVVLNSLRADAMKVIETGQGDYRLGLFEWSAVEGSSVTDPQAWADANPNLGRRIDPEAIAGKALRAAENGGDQEAKFRTEVLCQPMKSTQPQPIPLLAWNTRVDPSSTISGRPVFAVEVAWDRGSAAIATCGLSPDGTPHVEVVAYGPDTEWVVPELERLERLHSPDAMCLDPGGPAGSLIPAIDDAGLQLKKLTLAHLKQATGGFYDAVVKGPPLVHLPDDLLAQALLSARKRGVGDGWVLDRRRSGPGVVALNAVVMAHWLQATQGSRPHEPGLYIV
jgi:hypothetical protein